MFTEDETQFNQMDDNSISQSSAATASTTANKKNSKSQQSSSSSNVKPEEFKVNKESRASEAMKVKDDQIRLLTEQNNTLLKQLDKVRFILISYCKPQ